MSDSKVGFVPGLILFDIDGTLLKTGDTAHQQALLDAIEQVHRIRASLDGVPLGGMLDSQIVRLALEKQGVVGPQVRESLPELMDAMGRRYRELLDGEDRHDWLLPGVEMLVDRLQADHALGVLTGNASGIARAKLEAAGIEGYFSFGAFGNSAEHRYQLVSVAIQQAESVSGHRLQPGDALIVGDTPKDIEAARDSGARVLAVATGRYSVTDLEGHKPDALLPDLGDVDHAIQMLERLLPNESW